MLKDKQILEKFNKTGAWGLLVSVDLYQCNPKYIRSPKQIKEFVDKLCQLINLKKFGKTQIVNFGENPKVTGYSMTQLIETSLISGHFANQINSAYLDIFSCQAFPPYKTAKFCKDFFEAKKMKVKVNLRY